MGGMEQSPVSRMTPVDLPSSATYRPALPLGRRRSSFWNVVLLLVDDAIRRLGMVARSLTLGASRYLPVPRVSAPSAGSAAPRYNRCGKSGCRCHADPPQLHGPYFQWTAKVDGKTVNRRLSEREAGAYLEWIGNDRRLRSLVTEMRELAKQATDLILEDQN